MKAKIYFIGVAFLFASWAQAKHVTIETAQSVAQKFFSSSTGDITLRSSLASSFTLTYTAQKEASDVNLRSAQTGVDDVYFYVFNLPGGEGFIIIAADDRAYPILGYSLRGAFDYDGSPQNFVQWMNSCQEEIEKGLHDNQPLDANPAWQKIGTEITVNAANVTLSTAKWSQGNPYNLQCPLFGNERTITGCTATAMAIVMKYHADHGFAAIGTGSHSYFWNGDSLKVDFGTYDWANMPNNDAGFTNDTQRNAVARLMSHCGISIEATYGVSATSAPMRGVEKALVQYFGYDQSLELIYRDLFSDTEWKNLIKKEIDNNCPIVYSGYGSFMGKFSGHAFVVEGYNDNDDYAINWGWGGLRDGFFRLDDLWPMNGPVYSQWNDMIIGLKKSSNDQTDINQIWLTTSEGGKGMSKSVENIVQNQQFTVTAGALENLSYSAFRGKIAVALTDVSGSIKEIITTPLDRANNPLNPNYYVVPVQFQFSCEITKTFAPTDLIHMVVSTDNGVTWKIINGKMGVVDFLTVGVQNVAVTGVSLNSNTETLTVGGTFQLTPTVAPANATNKNVTWTSSDANIAEVNASGLVTAKAKGVATITVTTADGGKTATCTINVIDDSPPILEEGVVINGVRWATRNVDRPGAFAAKPEDTGMFYKWNDNVGWSATDPMINSNGSTTWYTNPTPSNSFLSWVNANDPSPAGWRVPNLSEIDRLLNEERVSHEWTTLNGINGTKYTDKTTGNSLFLPAAGARSYNNGTLLIMGTMGLYWSNSQLRGEDGYIIFFDSDQKIGWEGGYAKTELNNAISIRCVAGETVPVTGISLNKSATELTVGDSETLTCTLTPSNATNQNVTWSSNNTNVAEVNASGLVTAKAVGTASITVTTADGGKTATCSVTVQAVAVVPVTGVSLNSNAEMLTVGSTFDLFASISPANATNKNVTWTSSNTTVASVSETVFYDQSGAMFILGLVTANNPGTATITVTTVDGNYTATCIVTVQTATVPVTGVTLNSNAETLTVGSTFDLFASISPANATNKNVTWTSSNASVASVSETVFYDQSGAMFILGLVTANNPGTATITVTTEDGNKQATCTITVQTATVPVTGVSLNSNAETLNVGGTFQLTATVTPVTATNRDVTWSSSNPAVADVNSSGLITANSVGVATITVRTNDGNYTATCTVTVNTPGIPVTGVSLDYGNQTLYLGSATERTATITPSNATNKNITWSSSNPTVANLRQHLDGDPKILIDALSPGSATITVTTADGGHTASCVITVPSTVPVIGVRLNETAKSLYVGQSFTLIASIDYWNATNQNVTWTSSNPSVASVSPSGLDCLVTANAAGTATITVTTQDGGYTANCTVTVTSPYIATGTAGPLTWTLTHDGTLTISGNGGMPNYMWYHDGSLPSPPWGAYESSIKSVVVETGISRLGSGAFRASQYPTGNQYITSVSLPNGLTSIGGGCFSGSHFTEITLPNTLNTIENLAFMGCEGLTSLHIPASVINIVDNSTYQGNITFECRNLTSITVDAGNPNYSSLDGVLFNKNQTRLMAFPQNKGGDYTIPSTVTLVDAHAFDGWNTVLTSVTVPASVVNLQSWPYNPDPGFFSSCVAITSISVNSSNSVYTSDDGILYNKNKTTLLYYPQRKAGTTFEIPASVTTIGHYSFWFNQNQYLKTLIIPSSVTYIEHQGIGCLFITSVYIKNATPPSVHFDAFYSGNSATLYVPVGSKPLYESHAQWGQFGAIVEDPSLQSAPYKDGITGDVGLSAGSTEACLQGNLLHVTSPIAESITVYSLSGNVLYQTKKSAGEAVFKVGGLPRGILIVRGSSGWAQKLFMN